MTGAEAQRHLSAELRDRAVRTGDVEAMLGAVAAARAALAEDGGDPRSLALLGAAQAVLGENAADAHWLQAAVETYRQALDGSEGEGKARMHRNLGAVLSLLGRIADDAATLAEAAEHCRVASLAYAPDTLDWAIAQNNLADALRLLGERTGDKAALEASVEACRAALTVMTRAGFLDDWAMTSSNLANALVALGGEERLGEAVGLYEAALEAIGESRLALAIRHNLDRARKGRS